MNRLEQILTRAMEMRAGEMWMAPGQPARVRIGRDWKELGQETWAAHETKALLAAPLSEFDKREFFEKGAWSGQMRLMGRPLQLNLQITEQGIAGSVRWRGPEALDLDSWNLPVHLGEVLTRTRGLTLIVGPTGSGKSSLLYLLAQKLAQGPAQLVHLYSDLIPAEVPSRVSSFGLKSLAASSHSPADVVLIDEPGFEKWSTVLELAESGRHVVMAMTAADLWSALEKWRQFHHQSGRQGLTPLRVAMGTHLVSGLETALVPALELLLVTHNLKQPLAAGQWNLLEDEMRASGEKTGMRTLNQSLLHLLLRRKIEMRVAFHESSNPDELDLLLKKVGI